MRSDPRPAPPRTSSARPGRFGWHFCAACNLEHGPCEICDNDDCIPTICPTCRARPENTGWVELRESLRSGRHQPVEDVPAARPALAPRPRAPSVLQRRILDLMANYTVPTWVRRRVRRGGTRVWVWQRGKSSALSYPEIAWLLDCSFSYCRKVYRSVAE